MLPRTRLKAQQLQTSLRNTQTAKQNPQASTQVSTLLLSFIVIFKPRLATVIYFTFMYCNYVDIVKYPVHGTLICDFTLDFFPPAGRLSAAICRLCHGKFSPRSLRHAFKWPQDSIRIVDGDSDIMSHSPLLFHTDFQQLVGVQLDRDPRLSEFICKKCHAKFYKCHSILIRFLQRVNLPPVGEENPKHQ